jgi:hypothetical protein
MHAIAWFFGLTDASGTPYLFWSGIGANLAYLSAIGLAYRKVNCHASGCWRVGLHHVTGTHFITCRTHHPKHDGAAPATAQQIAQAHEVATS